MRNILIAIIYVISIILVGIDCKSEPNNIATSTDGVKISFSQQGSGETSIVFVHGWSNNKSIWDDQMSHFSEKYRLVAVDLAGFGESSNNRNDWTMENFSQDVVAVINKLGLKKVVLVGFSMGAPVVIETANRIPDRILGVVIVDMLHNVEMKFPPPVINYVDSLFMDLVFNPTNEKLMAGGFYKKNPEIAYKRVLAMLKDTTRIGWRESLRNTLGWQNEKCAAALSKITVPIRAINSENEPTNIEAFRKYVPSFQANIIPGTGHVIMWDAPNVFNQGLEADVQEFISQSKSE
jgi:pimeloyl-ACP methyl ester carboxylesterase